MNVQTIKDLRAGEIKYVAVKTADYEKCVEALKNVKEGTVCMKDIADDVLALIAPEGKEPSSVWDVRAESKRVIAYNDFVKFIKDSGIILKNPDETIEDVLSRAEMIPVWKEHVHCVQALTDAWDDVLADADNLDDVYEIKDDDDPDYYYDHEEEEEDTPDFSYCDDDDSSHCTCDDSVEALEEEDTPLEVFETEKNESEKEED